MTYSDGIEYQSIGSPRELEFVESLERQSSKTANPFPIVNLKIEGSPSFDGER